MMTYKEPEKMSTQTIVIETPKWSFVKRNEHGKVDYVSPIPSPFWYGRLDGFAGGDGDPMDCIWLGCPPQGNMAEGQVIGVVRFVDGGACDDKWLLSDTQAISTWQKKKLTIFFSFYAVLKNGLVLLRDRAINSRLDTIEFWVDVQ